MAALIGLGCDVDVDVGDTAADELAAGDSPQAASSSDDGAGAEGGSAGSDEGTEQSTGDGAGGSEESSDDGGSGSTGGPAVGCDPLAQDCAAAEACYLSGDGYACHLDESGASGGQFDDCEFVNTCDVGWTCAIPEAVGVGCGEGTGCCTAFCDLTAPGCGAGECVAVFPAGSEPVGMEDVGLCANYP